ncbi:FAD-dependent oxidoreductase [Ramlibacter sp. AW1]|uniref:FAD-dependent oxidoreductase n=1 Tax=Ramlibacter aurantiacus TaxID=2801330 RepID=A0A936ZXG8_9BURK|nr:FAD-dependent oxidoreductase [Ramlibacter aurantiacus]MBL0422895.1 FAD-dependent oxidoreductase [Ramlibacter aurantiacus]
MNRSKQVLVVGGGIGGMSAALALGRQGHAIDLIDLDPQWRVYGAGITITGATFRALQALGVLDEVLAQGWGGHGIQVCDTSGRPLQVLPTAPAEGADLPSTGGIMRPALHRILSSRTLASGARVRLGITVDALDEHDDGVRATFSDGTQATYDAVVGADGLFSRVRRLLFPDAPAPAYTGQSVWRLVAPRPGWMQRRHFFLGGAVKVGLTPVSGEQMYLFLLETTPRRPVMGDQALAAELRRLLQGYGGILAEIRERIGPDSGIVLRPLEAFELPPPWHRGRCLLIGDAAHPTTPQLASGAGMAVEDALVLADELAREPEVAQAFAGFMHRRYERCRLVVSNSLEIGRREQGRAPVEEQTRLVEESLRALARPI